MNVTLSWLTLFQRTPAYVPLRYSSFNWVRHGSAPASAFAASACTLLPGNPIQPQWYCHQTSILFNAKKKAITDTTHTRTHTHTSRSDKQHDSPVRASTFNRLRPPNSGASSCTPLEVISFPGVRQSMQSSNITNRLTSRYLSTIKLPRWLKRRNKNEHATHILDGVPLSQRNARVSVQALSPLPHRSGCLNVQQQQIEQRTGLNVWCYMSKWQTLLQSHG